MLRDEPAFAGKAARVSGSPRICANFCAALDLPRGRPTGHDDRLSFGLFDAARPEDRRSAERLLKQAGFVVRDVPEGHLCCGSAGVYNILQPIFAEVARPQGRQYRTARRRDRPGNIGCMTQIAAATAIPIVHTVELLDWVTRRPEAGGDGSGRFRVACAVRDGIRTGRRATPITSVRSDRDLII